MPHAMIYVYCISHLWTSGVLDWQAPEPADATIPTLLASFWRATRRSEDMRSAGSSHDTSFLLAALFARASGLFTATFR